MLAEVGDMAAPDPLRLNCRYFHLSTSIDVLYLSSDDTASGVLDTVVMTQPDFAKTEPNTDQVSTHYFLVEYVIQ